MPFGDKTGPQGNGPMTGRGAGMCAGYPQAGFMGQRGRGGCCGNGRFGKRQWAMGGGMGFSNQTPENAIGLKQQAEFLQQRLNSINEQIKKLDSDQ